MLRKRQFGQSISYLCCPVMNGEVVLTVYLADQCHTIVLVMVRLSTGNWLVVVALKIPSKLPLCILVDGVVHDDCLFH